MKTYVRSIEIRCGKPGDEESPCIACNNICKCESICDELTEWIAAGKVVSIQQDVMETWLDTVIRSVPRLFLWGAVAILIVKYAFKL